MQPVYLNYKLQFKESLAIQVKESFRQKTTVLFKSYIKPEIYTSTENHKQEC